MTPCRHIFRPLAFHATPYADDAIASIGLSPVSTSRGLSPECRGPRAQSLLDPQLHASCLSSSVLVSGGTDAAAFLVSAQLSPGAAGRGGDARHGCLTIRALPGGAPALRRVRTVFVATLVRARTWSSRRGLAWTRAELGSPVRPRSAYASDGPPPSITRWFVRCFRRPDASKRRMLHPGSSRGALHMFALARSEPSGVCARGSMSTMAPL